MNPENFEGNLYALLERVEQLEAIRSAQHIALTVLWQSNPSYDKAQLMLAAVADQLDTNALVQGMKPEQIALVRAVLDQLQGQIPLKSAGVQNLLQRYQAPP